MPTVYVDSILQQIVVEAPAGLFAINALLAVGNEDGTVSMKDLQRSTDVGDAFAVFAVPFAEFVRQDGVTQWGSTEVETVDNLNAAITDGASSGPGQVPAILFPVENQTIQVVDGENVNVQAVGDAVTEWTWPTITRDLAVNNQDRSRLGGRPNGGIAVYATTVVGSNTNGVVTRNFNIEVVAAAPFQNLRSYSSQAGAYWDAPATITHPMYRPNDGQGAADAWSYSVWIRGDGSGTQTLLAFGDSAASGAGVQIIYGATLNRIEVRMGEWSTNNNVRMRTANGSVPASPTWAHVLVVYDGNSTNTTADVISNGRVQVYIDGVLSALSNAGGTGYTGGWSASCWRYGQAPDGDPWNGVIIDEPAIWNGDQRIHAAEIYNAGAPRDLNSMPSAPRPYTWHRADGVPGVTFPTINEASTAPTVGGPMEARNTSESRFTNAVP